MYLQFTSVTKIYSSWCIFTGASDINNKDYNPIACSSSNYTFEPQDKHKIDNLRAFIKIHFNTKNSLFYEKEFKLINRSQSTTGDYDILVQIVQKTELDDKIVYFIQDETDGCELHTFKYFNFFEINDVVRIRGFKVFDKNIVMQKFSNLLKIPNFFDLYKETMNKIAQKSKFLETNSELPPIYETKEKKFDNLMMIETPTNFGISAIYEEGKYPLRCFSDLDEKDEKFVMYLNVVKIFPNASEELVSILCKKCYMSVVWKNDINLSPEETFYCNFCRSEESALFYFNLGLVCRENEYSNKLITLYLSTYDNEGASFLGMFPKDYYTQFEVINGILGKLTQPDVYIAVLVESIKTGHSETDRVFRIIGDYQNNLV